MLRSSNIIEHVCVLARPNGPEVVSLPSLGPMVFLVILHSISLSIQYQPRYLRAHTLFHADWDQTERPDNRKREKETNERYKLIERHVLTNSSMNRIVSQTNGQLHVNRVTYACSL